MKPDFSKSCWWKDGWHEGTHVAYGFHRFFIGGDESRHYKGQLLMLVNVLKKSEMVKGKKTNFFQYKFETEAGISTGTTFFSEKFLKELVPLSYNDFLRESALKHGLI